jgi:hypothetical protein
MEHTETKPIGEAVRDAINETVGSVRSAALQTGIPYTTLDRRLRDGSQFTVAELNRLAELTGRLPSDFIGGSR